MNSEDSPPFLLYCQRVTLTRRVTPRRTASIIFTSAAKPSRPPMEYGPPQPARSSVRRTYPTEGVPDRPQETFGRAIGLVMRPSQNRDQCFCIDGAADGSTAVGKLSRYPRSATVRLRRRAYENTRSHAERGNEERKDFKTLRPSIHRPSET